MIDFGIPLLIGYPTLLVIFIFLSDQLFENSEFANFIFVLMGLVFVSKLNQPKRNDFFKLVYNKKTYRLFRIAENIIFCMPFIIFLLYREEFSSAMVLVLIASIITFFSFSTNLNVTIPTPFNNKPFEFAVGFRKTLLIFPIAYFLIYISVSVGNFNLGVFSILLVGITCLSYYSKLENEYFVWNYNLSASGFLREKIKTCLLYFSLLILPNAVVLFASFFNERDTLIAFVLLCYVYLIIMVFAKYSSFPNEMNMSQGISVGLSFIFPPILLILMPVFYAQSVKRLKVILDD